MIKQLFFGSAWFAWRDAKAATLATVWLERKGDPLGSPVAVRAGLPGAGTELAKPLADAAEIARSTEQGAPPPVLSTALLTAGT